jgi:chloramphenicol-sensitive protein RarD
LPALVEGRTDPDDLMPPITAQAQRDGLTAAIAAYVIWGFFPLMFLQLAGVDSVLIVAHRIVWSLLVVAAILILRNRLGEVSQALRDPQVLWRLGASTVFVAINWLTYVWAVENGRVLETSFGYFLNPLVNVVLGMVLLGERQNQWQWVAIAIAAVAMVLQTIGLNGFPWLAVVIAVTFALYGYMRKTVKVGSAPGLFIETLLLMPLSIAYIIYTIVVHGPGPHATGWGWFWLIFTGPATSLTLLLFAYGVQRLRLTTIGIIQYIAPSIQFVLAVAVFREELNTMRLFSFALIWLSLVIFTVDSIRRARTPVLAPQP